MPLERLHKVIASAGVASPALVIHGARDHTVLMV